MAACIAVLCAVLLSAQPCGAQPSADESLLSVLSYNVHGVSRFLAKDNPRDRSPTIGWLASRYDLVLLQEDFEYYDLIAGQMPGRATFRGNGMGRDPRRVAAKAVLFPAAFLLPRFSPPYGAGLTTLVDAAKLEASDVERQPYTACSGWVRRQGNCWAAKGFLRVRIRLPNGAAVEVYNTHLAAGSGERSQAVRRQQLDELAAGIERLSGESAVIAAGDFNCAFGRPGDGDMLMSFRERVGLDDSGAGPELPVWRERDYVLYRGGPGVALTIDEAGEADEFISDRRALSDHPALFVRFRARAVP